MRLNSDLALKLGARLWRAYGCNWQAVREAGEEGPDGVITVKWPSRSHSAVGDAGHSTALTAGNSGRTPNA